MIFLDFNDLLVDIFDFSVEVDFEKGSDLDYLYDGSESCESDMDGEYILEFFILLGNRRGKKSRNVNQKSKEFFGSKQGRSVCFGKGKSVNLSNVVFKDKGKKDNVVSSK